MKADEFNGSAPLLVHSKAAVFGTLTTRTPELSDLPESRHWCSMIQLHSHNLA